MTAKPLVLHLGRNLARRQLAVIAVAVAAAIGGAAMLTVAAVPATAALPPASADAVPATALTVETTRPATRKLSRTLSASGSVEARDELIVGSDATGIRLVELRVDVGSQVRKGQLLARGDDRQLQSQLAQKEAVVRQTRAELMRARDQLERAEQVKDAGVYSPEAVLSRRMAAEAAAAALDLALAQRREIAVRIEQATVLAPADGVISRRIATVGSVIQPGMELFRLIHDGEVEWRAELPDHVLGEVRAGALVQVEIGGRQHEGRVRLVAPTIDARSRNGLVHVSLPRSAALKPGAHLQGRIEVSQSQGLVLPESAVLSRDGRPFAYVVEAQGRARAVPLQLGGRQGGFVEVTGLPATAEVIAVGAGFVKEGEQVRVAPGARS